MCCFFWRIAPHVDKQGFSSPGSTSPAAHNKEDLPTLSKVPPPSLEDIVFFFLLEITLMSPLPTLVSAIPRGLFWGGNCLVVQSLPLESGRASHSLRHPAAGRVDHASFRQSNPSGSP